MRSTVRTKVQCECGHVIAQLRSKERPAFPGESASKITTRTVTCPKCERVVNLHLVTEQ